MKANFKIFFALSLLFVGFFLFSDTTYAAITRIPKGSIASKTRSATFQFSNVSLTAGNSLLVAVAVESFSGTSPFISATWNGISMSRDFIRTTRDPYVAIFSLHNVAGGTGNVIVTFSCSGNSCPVAKAMVVIEVAGLDATTVLDQARGAEGSGTTPSSGFTSQTIQAEEFLFGIVATEGPVGDITGTWQYSFLGGERPGTTGGAAASNITLSEGFRIVNVQNTYAAAKTGIRSRPWTAAIATYRAAPPSFVVSGNVYGADRLTPATSTVKLVVDGTTAYSVQTNASGVFTFPRVFAPPTSTVITMWLDNNTSLKQGALVTRFGGGNIVNVNLYVQHVILRHEDNGPLLTSNLAVCDRGTGAVCSGDTDLIFDVDTGGTATFFGSSTLYLYQNKTFSASSSLVLQSGNITSLGTFFQSTNATTTLLSSGSLAGNGSITFGSLVIGTSTSAITTMLVQDITVGNVLYIQNSNGQNSLDAGSRVITFLGGGTPFVLGASSRFISNNSTVVYKATVPTTVAPTTYYNLRVEPGAYLTSHAFGSGIVSVLNAFTAGDGVHQGIVSAAPHNTTFSVTGNFTVASGTIFEAPPSSAFSLGGNIVMQGGFAGSGGTVTFNGGTLQTITGVPFQIANGIISNIQGVRADVSDLTAQGNLTILNGTRLRAPTGVLALGGNYTNQGVFEHNNGIVELQGTSRQELSGFLTGVSAFNTLRITNISGNDPLFDPSVIFKNPSDATMFQILVGGVKVQFATSSTYTFSSIDLQGTSLATPVYLRSMSPDASAPLDQWSLVAGSSQTVLNVDVQNSFACGGVMVDAGENPNRDSRNNACWRFGSGYAVSGFLYSHIIDTQIQGGTTPNAILWRGTEPAGTRVKFQFASSNATSGPWNYLGWNGFFCSPIGSYSGASGKAIEIKAACHVNERYLRYKVILETDDTTITPVVEEIVLNYAR